jgi:hypothetical protein
MIQHYEAGWCIAHEALEKTIQQGSFPKESFSDRELKIIQEVFSEYILYIWLILGDTRCNKQGITAASMEIDDYINNRQGGILCQ